ncbi:MAG: hypothetical protein IPK55_14815 [Streptococcus sp.]|nr:hypothetical protein [Streptococcus sp.]
MMKSTPSEFKDEEELKDREVIEDIQEGEIEDSDDSRIFEIYQSHESDEDLFKRKMFNISLRYRCNKQFDRMSVVSSSSSRLNCSTSTAD